MLLLAVAVHCVLFMGSAQGSDNLFLKCEYLLDLKYDGNVKYEGFYPLNTCITFYTPWTNEVHSEMYSCYADDPNIDDIKINWYRGPNCDEIIDQFHAEFVRYVNCDGGPCTDLYSSGTEMETTALNITCPSQNNTNDTDTSIKYSISNICIPVNDTDHDEVCKNKYTNEELYLYDYYHANLRDYEGECSCLDTISCDSHPSIPTELTNSPTSRPTSGYVRQVLSNDGARNGEFCGYFLFVVFHWVLMEAI